MRVLAPAGTYSARVTTLWDRYIRGAGLTLTLVALVVMSVAWPVQSANWVHNMPSAVFIALAGVVLSWVLERSSLRNFSAHLISLMVAMVVVVASAISMTPGSNEADRVVNLIKEINFWLDALGTEEVRAGRVEFASFMLSVSWLLGYVAGWQALRNRQAWAAVLLGGIIVALTLSNVGDESARSLTMFMGASVLLLIHMHTAQRMVRWRARNLSFDPSTVLSQSGFILAAGLIVVLAIVALPTPKSTPLSVAADKMEDALDEAEAEFSRLFHALPSRRAYRTITYQDEVFFRGNPSLTDELLFTVNGGGGSYWRAKSYTTYTSTGWKATEAEFAEFIQPVASDDIERAEVIRRYEVRFATDTFFTGGLPVAVSETAEALVRGEVVEDPLQLRFSEGREFFSVRTGLNYTSTGNESIATRNQLSEAGTDYPEWITETYLQLPDALPPRIRDLANSITSGHLNNYDKVESARQFVISFPYNLDIPAPPENRDGVDYFLFDLRQGYCDYYASSLTVLLRAAGIPARYVLGYAPGNPNRRGQFEVLDLHYHTWVEAYFPEYGWVVFEATPPNAIEFGGGSSPVAQGPSGILEEELGDDPVPEDEEEGLDDVTLRNGGDSRLSIESALAVGVSALVFLFALAFYRLWWRLGRFDRAAELYAKTQRLAALLGIPRRTGQTPVEYADALAGEFPEGASDIRVVAQVYAGRRYGGGLVSMTALREAEQAWSRLRWLLLKRMFRTGSG